MEIKVSVIIPVYNGEEYLEECIKSLINQTLKNCEFIFINDGSTDSSKEIIEKYKLFDSRIKLINQENQGVSSARNNGLGRAQGEFIGFVDADDYVELDMFENLYKTIKEKNTDLVICNYESSLEGHKGISKLDLPINEVLNRDYIDNKLIRKFIESDELNTVCVKLYKKRIIDKYSVTFPKGVELGEDGLFNLRYMMNIKNLIYIQYMGYHYREVEGSATRNIVEKDYFKRALDVYTTKLNEIEEIKLNEKEIIDLKTTKFINSIISNIYIYLIPNEILSLNQRLKYVKNMINNSYVIEALPIYIENHYDSKGKYEKAIINMINKKNIIGLYILTMYSWKRNH